MAVISLPSNMTVDAQNVTPVSAVASSKTSNGADDSGPSQTVATQPLARYMIFGVLALAGGLVGGLLLQKDFHPGMTHLPVLPATTGIFALLYVMAQAIERVLVPVSWFGGGFLEKRAGNVKNTKAGLAKERQAATVRALKPPATPGAAQAAAQDAANATHAVDQYKANLTATTFGVAALLAMLVSGYTGLFLLTAVGLHAAGWLDVLVTGLAVAGGTKPLHDLISNISSSSQNKNAASTS